MCGDVEVAHRHEPKRIRGVAPKSEVNIRVSTSTQLVSTSILTTIL